MSRETKCGCSVFEEIDAFTSLSEFERFQKYLAEQIESGELSEVRVLKRYFSFDEQWFKCKGCHKKWRLVHPDFPFKGLFKRVSFFKKD
jgi:hypothetical protein